jgi:hypothetical protein
MTHAQAMVERHAAHLSAEKTKQLMHLAKSIHVDFPAYPAQKHHQQSSAKILKSPLHSDFIQKI